MAYLIASLQAADSSLCSSLPPFFLLSAPPPPPPCIPFHQNKIAFLLLISYLSFSSSQIDFVDLYRRGIIHLFLCVSITEFIIFLEMKQG